MGTWGVPLTLTIHLLCMDMDVLGTSPSELCAHSVCTLLSSQIPLCHKLVQLRRHAIISLITFHFDERSRHFFESACCIGLGEASFQFFAYFGRGCVSSLGGLQALQGTCIPSALQPRLCMPGTSRAAAGWFLLTNPNTTSVSSGSSNTRIKKDPEQSRGLDGRVLM